MVERYSQSQEVIGFALSGGGSRGASQVGALLALSESGIQPDVVVGTSAGAVNAAWAGLFPTRLDRLEATWLTLRTRDVFPGNKFRILLNLARRGHVHVADAWETFLREQLSDACFEDSSVPLAIVAVRLKDGQRVVFDSGEIVPAIMASTAIPGVFPPHRVGDELFVDGGVVEYLPLATVLERGATTVYAMDCSWFSYNSAYRGSVVDRCSRISASNYVERATALSATRGVDVHLLRPELPDFDDSRDFRHTASLVATGYDHAMQYLNEETDAAASGI